MSMSGSFLPSLGRQQPKFTWVEGADIVMKSSEFEFQVPDYRELRGFVFDNLILNLYVRWKPIR